MDNNEKKLIINLVKTDKCCFVTDCTASSGYDFEYHKSKIGNIYFDGEKPETTFYKNWFKIKQYPSIIQQLQKVPSINHRYELKDQNLVSENLPLIIKEEDFNKYSEDIFVLYEHCADKQDPILVDVECTINTIMEIENFELPLTINYNAIRKWNWNDKEFKITNIDINHQLFDKIIFPEVMLHTRPCSISSQLLYCLVRQYIKENINLKVAKITSDYDFCFTVKKIIPLIEPQTISYQNIFANSKKERNKIQYKIKTFKEIDIFEMTHDQSKYQNYTVIKPIFADNEVQLKDKIDEFLQNLIDIINKPLTMCPHCKGNGYIEEIVKIKQKDLIKE
jgi:hypothetical protein